MWTREELKSNAKMILRRTYWMGFVACLITSFLTGGSGGFMSGWNFGTWKDGSEYVSLEVVMGLLFIAGIALIFSLLFSAFVSWPVIIGRNRFFMASREQDENLQELLFGFKNGAYFHIVKTTFMIFLYTTLWSMLFIIPGIIKAYEYFFVPYILSENPGIDTKRAFELSREMSNGRKWKMFVLDLSFLGWNLLGAMCCGVGLFFVAPYYQAVLAELYAASRADVLLQGKSDDQELPGYTM